MWKKEYTNFTNFVTIEYNPGKNLYMVNGHGPIDNKSVIFNDITNFLKSDKKTTLDKRIEHIYELVDIIYRDNQ